MFTYPYFQNSCSKYSCWVDVAGGVLASGEENKELCVISKYFKPINHQTMNIIWVSDSLCSVQAWTWEIRLKTICSDKKNVILASWLAAFKNHHQLANNCQHQAWTIRLLKTMGLQVYLWGARKYLGEGCKVEQKSWTISDRHPPRPL